MNKYKILIVEPSSIVAAGLDVIVQGIGMPIEISHLDSFINVNKSKSKNESWDIVFINPFTFSQCPHVRGKLLRCFSNAVLIGMITNIYDRKFCHLLNDVIYLNDSDAHIRSIVSKYLKNGDSRQSSSNVLSDRETEVLMRLVSGESLKEIADHLFISTHTVVSHRRNISTKLGIKSIAAMAVYAVATKLIDPNESLESMK